MALNVTTAVFRPGFNIATASPSLVQWDQGQTLQIEGVELPSAYQVEFTNAVTVQAITMIGNENGVEIPNELLQQSFPINAYIVLHETAEDRETEYWATIYVKARQQPREETPDPEQISVIDQTIAALQEGVAEAQAASQAVQNMGVEAETLPEGSEATVEKTVDPETGEVTLGFGIPEGRHGATGATPDIQIGTVTTGAPGSQADASITGTREEPRLNLTIPQGPQGDAGVTSVNGKTGAVVLDASDVGAKPASYEAPVSSVNGKTGTVVLDASDVGAKPASYEAPVSSVNEKTGAVVLDSEDIRYDSTETYSDGTVGKELGAINSALSSLQSVTEIIDTASGAIASFPDGAGLPMRSLVAEINPVQDLHGYDAPYPAGGGKNKLDRTGDVNGYYLSQNGSTTSNPDCCYSALIPVTAGSTYTLSGISGVGAYKGVVGYDSSGNWVSGLGATSSQIAVNTSYSVTFTVPSGVSNIRVSCGINDKNVQVESGSSATSYQPYANICPIAGHTGVQGQRTGVNLFDKANVSDVNGYFGTTILASSKHRVIYIPCKPNTTYTVSNPANNRKGLGYTTELPAVGVDVYGGAAGTITTGADAKYLVCYCYNENIDSVTYQDVLNAFQFELGSSVSPYEPYISEAISVSWEDEAGTVYGGTATYNGDGTWTLVAEYAIVDMGALNWSIDTRYANAQFYTQLGNYDPNVKQSGNVLCSMYKTDRMAWNSNVNCTIGIIVDSRYLLCVDNAYSDTNSFRTGVTGQKVIYELTTPVEHTITTGELIETLVGQNNIWVDTGDVTVTYQASIKGYIDKVLAT